MSDHYCCKTCGQRYDSCKCFAKMPRSPYKKKPSSLAEQIAEAQKVVGMWPQEKLESVRLEGADLMKQKEQP